MYDSLRRVAKARRPIRRTGSGQGISSYILYADSKMYPNAFELFGAIKRAWAGTNQLTKVKDAGGLLILKVDAGAPGIEANRKIGQRDDKKRPFSSAFGFGRESIQPSSATRSA